MKLTIVVHEAEEGGYWAEVPAITGCVSQGESLDELLLNVREAVEGCREWRLESRSPSTAMPTSSEGCRDT